MVLATDNLDLITELGLEGRELRSHSIDGALSAWYSGGLCVDRERVAVSSTIAKDSDFGILDQTIEIRERSAFVLVLVLVLKQW
jgi:hypothetical protein